MCLGLITNAMLERNKVTAEAMHRPRSLRLNFHLRIGVVAIIDTVSSPSSINQNEIVRQFRTRLPATCPEKDINRIL